ncbi:But2 family protein [Schizosaccharomyces octosporus yFS286]|uniref:But2 family protein n=1 Tax=Schizosaccharomyces octosporus (strain yFS286) TaxID=483514 RepID=S9RHE5_SCHOY|nr:But2 family protein [Schizosaccharomyces octosporus yFS286]EPX73464.1 But2 family protein [Schizosaccharomyces octosporus yFS286]
MKFSLSAFFFTIVGATLALAAPATNLTSTIDKEFSITAIHSGQESVHLHSLYVDQSGHVLIVGETKVPGLDIHHGFRLKDGQLSHGNNPAHLDKDGALTFESTQSAPLEGFKAKPVIGTGVESYNIYLKDYDYPVACPVPNTTQVYQIYYGKGNGNDCIWFVPWATLP